MKQKFIYVLSAMLWLQLLSFSSEATDQAAADTLTFFVSKGGSSSPKTIHPDQTFATIGEAKTAVRELKNQGRLDRPVKVYIEAGVYFLDTPLLFTPDDSGTETAPVIYTSYGGRALLHGGKKISNWKKHKGDIYSTTLPEVKKGNWHFNQLYINGELRQRARTPNKGFHRVKGFPDGAHDIHYHTDCQRFEFAEGDINPKWKNLEDVEVIVYHFWTDSHLPIQSIDTKNNIVTFRHKAGKIFTDGFSDAGAKYIVENVWEGLDEPGEWYLNRKTGKLYYIPLPGEDMAKVEVVAPFTEKFITIEGDPLQNQYVEHITFDKLDFSYTNWQLPPGNSNDDQGSASVPAAITLTGARHIAFTNCEVKNIGTFAFEVGKGSTYNQFIYNTISQIAAGGFRVNGGTDEDPPVLRTGNNIISDNDLHHFGEVYPSAVGVLLMQTYGNRVEHNNIYNGWYTGVSVGWEWGYQRSISRDNIIAYNHIHTIGQGLLSDMGGIYTLGVSPGTIIRNNLIHDVQANQYGGWGIYNDEGSSYLLVENNVVYNTNFAGYNIHYAKEITVRNNVFALGKLAQLSRGKSEPHKSVYFENNIIYWKEGELLSENWSDQPYPFYRKPEGKVQEANSTFEMDWNIYFNPDMPLEKVSYNGKTWEAWHSMGKDQHSEYADPLFVDPENHDFRLRAESPAFKLGFKPIDISTVGPREVKKL
ncbi:hypothetical protein GCM10023188_39310 [Pontibacter saemangeumensis]|uniref:Right handed beta helix region n=1 Tax=Pontibacter saemangeumensis TaxID=1084525 RepID=A0ABP8M0N3_9BACT